jgi:hypothetical protein
MKLGWVAEIKVVLKQLIGHVDNSPNAVCIASERF